MNEILNNISALTFILIVIPMFWTIILKPILIKKNVLNIEQLDLIDFACEKAVQYAEQIYKNDNNTDRQELALDYALDILNKSDIIPDEYFYLINGIIESHVLKLPKTHNGSLLFLKGGNMNEN
jgi:hypothetical protein